MPKYEVSIQKATAIDISMQRLLREKDNFSIFVKRDGEKTDFIVVLYLDTTKDPKSFYKAYLIASDGTSITVLGGVKDNIFIGSVVKSNIPFKKLSDFFGFDKKWVNKTPFKINFMDQALGLRAVEIFGCNHFVKKEYNNLQEAGLL